MSKQVFTKCFVLAILGFLLIGKSFAQLRFSAFSDVGKTNVSEGTYLTSSAIGAYKTGKTEFMAGSQLNVKYNDKKALGGFFLSAAHDLQIKNFPFEVKGFFVYNPFSDVARESNYGLLTKVTRGHLTCQLGTNFRHFYISNQAVETYGIESNKSMVEKWNLMYSIRYGLKPEDHVWNIGISITNIDYFLINQETNPMISLNGKYRLKDNLELLTEIWYKGAGSLNISANHFGYFVRTGLVWKLS